MVRLRLDWRSAPPGMRSVYEDLSQALVDHDFYLAGGTALALLEGHRVSVDLDLFSPSLTDAEALLGDLEDRLQEHPTVTSMSRKALDLEISGIRVSLINYRYPLLLPTLSTQSGALKLADRDDIAAMKLSAITSRGTRKDFIDFWILIDRYRSLPEYLDLFKQKYSKRDVGHVVRSLVYFAEADDDPPLRLLAPISWEKVKEDLKAAVQALL
ncbi:MAG: nucleotidyl transferase AbiEii/AbiGii toxin family protein [bacterium]|nr:nucleotidyl transferase AbiEii/AbiGii toxin family protein [bacterium]